MSDTNNETLLDLDNLDNLDVGGVEAAPDFIEPPTGRYELKVHSVKKEKYNRKDDNGIETEHYRFRNIYAIVKTIELKDKDELVPAEGSLFSETFTLTQDGLKYWKARAQGILGPLGNATVGEVNTKLANEVVTFKADIKQKTKSVTVDGEKKEYTNMQMRIVAA